MIRCLHGRLHSARGCRTWSVSSDMWTAALHGLGLPADFSLGTREHLAPDRVLITQGRATRRFVLVVDGEVCVCDGDEVLALLGPGAWCGEIGLLSRLGTNDGRATATVRTKTAARVLSLAPWEFKSMIDMYPATKALLLASAQSRHGRTNGGS